MKNTIPQSASPATGSRTDADFDALKYTPATASRPAGRWTPPNPAAGSPNAGIQAINDAVLANSAWVQPLRQQMARVIVGQEQLIDRLMVGLISNGHILLEGVPGLAKTLALKTLAAAVGVRFQRMQFTPDDDL
jgi:MoxR-like ATPase